MTIAASTAATFCATLADEWARAGVTDAVVCPGSRSSPLVLALEAEVRIRIWVRLDERSAAFFALGLGLGSGRPALIVTTSGTAAAELHAAVVEAHQARVPLICVTADRPPELHRVGAPQAIEQAELFRGAVRWFAGPGVPSEQGRPAWRSLAARVFAEAVHSPLGPGPVHLNLAFRDPLVGIPGELPPGRAGGAPWHDASSRGVGRPSRESLEAVRPYLRPGVRGVIVAGEGAGDATELLSAAAALGWPVLADPRSGCRLAGEAALGATVVAAADGLCRVETWTEAHHPEVILRAGDPPASKVIGGWLAATSASGAVHIAADPWWSWKDPGRETSVVVPVRADALLGGLELDVVGGGPWARAWAEADVAAQRSIDATLAGHLEVTEPFVARTVHAIAEGSWMLVSSSMPVRDVEWFAAATATPVRVLANRGANGIDGVVSTGLGVAAAMGREVLAASAGAMAGPAGPPRRPGYLLVGDLALLHDVSALVRPLDQGPTPAVVVVIDNRGGGVFSFLPQATSMEAGSFERLFGTPHQPAPAALIEACGYDVREVSEAADLAGAVRAASDATTESGVPAFVVVHTDRSANVAVHAELDRAVARAIAP